MRTLRLSLLGLLAAPAFGQCLSLDNAAPGTRLAMGDDSLRVVVLPFSFPFQGTSYDRITIDSNGAVRLGDASLGNPADPTPTATEFRADPHPTIALLWDDWASHRATAGNGVFFLADSNQASIVFRNVPQNGTGPGLLHGEITLEPSGRIALHLDARTTLQPTGEAIFGVSSGHGANATLKDFANAQSATAGAAYETFSATNALDLAGGAVVFTPQGNDFALTRQDLTACAEPILVPPLASAPVNVGSGCPTPSHNGSIYELFSGNGTSHAFDLAHTSLEFVKNGASYTIVPGPGFDPDFRTRGTVLQGVGDDTQTTVSLGAMGSFALGAMPSVSHVQISSNGYLWLPEGPLSFMPKAATFHSYGARIAPAWMDFVPNLGSSPIWWENSDAGYCQATWFKLGIYGEGGSHTFQARLKQNGNIVLSYLEFQGSATRAPLVGITAGGNAVDVGSEDLAISGQAQPITRGITGVTSMQHTSTPLGIGRQWSLRASLPDPQTFGGFLWFGVSNPGLPLDFVGMSGCTQYASLDYVAFLLFQPGGPYQWNIQVPYDPAFGGVNLFSQAAAFSSLNNFGVIASNGLQHTAGL